VGLKGTSHSLPQSEQVVLCISLGPPKLRLGPPLNPLSLIVITHAG
jgi:hypothetical protein